MRPTSPVPIFVGIGLTVIGFVLIIIAWAQVAGEDVVPYQLPYLVSGGLSGIGLILVGLTVATIQSRRIEGAERARQIEQVAASVAALREALVPTDDDLLSVSPDAAAGFAVTADTQDLSTNGPVSELSGAPEVTSGAWERP